MRLAEPSFGFMICYALYSAVQQFNLFGIGGVLAVKTENQKP